MMSLVDVERVNGDIEARAFRGIEITNSLITTARGLENSGLLDVSQFQFDMMCSNNGTAPVAQQLGLDDVQDEVTTGVTLVQRLLKDKLLIVEKGLRDVTSANRSVDKALEKTLSNDWYLKLFLVMLNVVNFLLWIGAFLTRCGIDFHGYQKTLAWLVLPVFGLLLLATIAIMGLTLSLALINAGEFLSVGTLYWFSIF